MSHVSFIQFCEQVLRVELTPAQRVLVSVAFDRAEITDLDEGDQQIASQLFGPVEAIPKAARAVFVAVCGARAGKSYILGALYSLWRALTADLSRLAPGEQASALIIAPDLRLARQCLRYARGASDLVPAISRCIESDSSDGFTLVRPDGARVAIEVLPATRGGSAVRGRSLVSAVLDECSFFRDDSAVVNDSDIFRAVAPRVMAGGLVVLASTPWIESGLLYTEFSNNFGEPRTAIAALAPTLLMRDDDATASTVARERARDATNCEREFDAMFIVGGAGLFFGPELIGPAIQRQEPLRSYAVPGALPTIGGDIGLERDASAFVAVHREGDRLLVADALELRPKKGAPLKLSEVVKQACAFAFKHGQKVIHVDHHVLGPAREHLLDGFMLRPVAGGQEEKAKRFLAVREQFRQGRIAIPGPLARLANELGLIISRPTPGGKLQILLPRRGGSHMDLSAAFILAAYRASDRAKNRMLHVLEMRSQQRNPTVQTIHDYLGMTR